MKLSLKDRVQGSLMGVMIGDAMGMPWEMYSAGEILELTGGKGVEGFTSPLYRRIKDTEHLVIGSTTDDWQLTEVVARSLIRRKGICIMDMALGHIWAYENSQAGWGGTTKRGMEEIKSYIDSRGCEGRYPGEMSRGKGCGNGVGMRISPIGLYLGVKVALHDEGLRYKEPEGEVAFDICETWEWVSMIGKLTHPDMRAITSAYALASIIVDLFTFENLFNPGKDQKMAFWLLERTISKLKRVEDSSMDDNFSSRLEVLMDESLLFGSVEKLREKVGVGCLALESICFAIAIFLRHPRDFRSGILEAINSGGDADTIGAMVGSLIGSLVGVGGIPKEWREEVENERAEKLGEELYKVAEIIA